MRTWTRSIGVGHCGRCGHAFALEEPMLTILPWKLKRCATCAGEPVPADLPPRPSPQLPVRESRRRDRRDAKQRQVGGDA